ncbi:ABC transporter ATP-binding protein [Reyranella sp.]|uniref:ABC transporter ATP-binding protein n=1 Tax=Reyranella sp. TaxID=1929291 RepID=UPI003782FC03
MAEIVISGVSRSFGTVRAVDQVDLTVGDGEFFTLLGPSGCGKTTLLRMIAGFCELDRGAIRFGRTRIDQLPAHVRDIGMVFQNYAVFPNLTVAGNVAYGLKARKVAGTEIDRRVDEALALVQLSGYGARWPHQLSGGQLQRVAIARALVIRPQVLLFDEPLSNLDARLRVNMRTEIRELQKSLGITAIYVTHDQEEAMSVSDRIALMNAGRLEQVGVPVDIYRHPVSRFAAEFMGTTNLLAGSALDRAGEKLVSLRPEALRLAGDAPADWPRLAGTLARLELLGPLVRLDMALPDGTLVKAALLDQPGLALQAGASITLAYDPARLTVLP